MEKYDIVIVGAGPGGLTAGIYAGRQGTKNLILDKGLAGGIGREVPQMENYPGFDNVSGLELVEIMKEQAIKNCELHENENVLEITKNDDEYRFTIKTDNDSYLSKTVILATGSSHRELNAKGEEEFKGKGVSYCATCDAPLYRGRSAAVVGYSPREEAEAAFLSEVCSEVLYFPMYPGETTSLPESVRIIREKVMAVEIGDAKKLVRTAENAYPVDGVFILREAVAPGQLVPGLETEGPHVTVNRRMETSIPGIFACGDISGLPYQYIKAAGEGNVAALSAVEYLDKQKRRKENG